MGLFSNDDEVAAAQRLVQQLEASTAALHAAEAALKHAKEEALEAIHRASEDELASFKTSVQKELEKILELEHEAQDAEAKANAAADHHKRVIEASAHKGIESIAAARDQAKDGVEDKAKELLESAARSLEDTVARGRDSLGEAQQRAIESIGHNGERAVDAIGGARDHATESVQSAGQHVLATLQERAEHACHDAVARISHAAEQGVAALTHAREQVLGAVEHATHAAREHLEQHGGSWVEKILHSANTVLRHVPVVGTVTGVAEDIVHGVNEVTKK